MKLSIAAFVLLGSLASAQGPTPFDGCGTLVPGVTCDKLFQADAGGLYIVLADLSAYQNGDYLRMTGTTDGCISFCMQGNGCLTPSQIQPCSIATDLCFGDGTSGACPCGNNGSPGRGCQTSIGSGGALLAISGTTTPDTVLMTSSGERPTSISIFIQGPSSFGTPVFFGDGLRCVSGTLKRLYTKSAVGGVVSAPVGAEPSITTRSAALGDPLGPGSTRHYQVYFRDGDPAFCPAPTGSTFNISNGKTIVW